MTESTRINGFTVRNSGGLWGVMRGKKVIAEFLTKDAAKAFAKRPVIPTWNPRP